MAQVDPVAQRSQDVLRRCRCGALVRDVRAGARVVTCEDRPRTIVPFAGRHPTRGFVAHVCARG